MNNKPNKWLAAVLGLFLYPLGMLYVAQAVWSVVYLIAAFVAVFILWHYQVAAGLALLSLYVVCAVHAYRLAGRYPADKARPHYSRWYGLAGVTAGFFVVVVIFRAFLFEPFSAPSGSMLPTIVPGSNMAVLKWGYGHYSAYGITLIRGGITSELHRGDIIVFDNPENPSNQFVKRIIGLPGDKIVYRDKMLSINGIEVPRRNDGIYQHAGRGAPVERFARFRETLDSTTYQILISEGRPPIYRDGVTSRAGNKCKYDDHGLACELPEGQYFVMGDHRDDSRDSRYWGFVPADNIVGKVVYILQ